MHQLLLAPFAKLSKDRLCLLSHIPFTSRCHTREHNSFDIDENGYSKADHDEQLNTYPLDGVLYAALSVNIARFIHKDQEGFFYYVLLLLAPEAIPSAPPGALLGSSMLNKAQHRQASSNSNVDMAQKFTLCSRRRHNLCLK